MLTKAFKYRLYPTPKQEVLLEQTLTTCRFLYKAESAGVEVRLVNPRNTSQMCSGCGKIVPKELKDRVHCCPHCGLVMDRDLNASINIYTAGSAGINAFGDLASTYKPKTCRQARSLN